MTELLNRRLNLLLSVLLLAVGASSLVVSALSKDEENFLMTFRYMTMNGTAFTTLTALILSIVCAAELRTGRKILRRQLYYFRLCAAVTECIIAAVILLSFFPFVPDNPDLLTYDSFCMHIILPLLTIVSFLLNPSPAESVHPLKRLSCAWLITLYAAVVTVLILTGAIPQDKIPYSFMDFGSHPLSYSICIGCFVYSFAYILSVWLTDGNRRLSRLWTQ